METVEIKYFLQTAKQGSVRKAAEIIGISPSAISKAIGRLEQELETMLIEKAGRGLILTAAGKKLERQGAEFLALERQIVESHAESESALRIKIVGPELPLSHWGTIAVKQIYEAFPKIQIDFEATSNESGLEMVDSFAVDFSFFATQKKMTRDKSIVKKLGDVRMKTFVSPRHSLAKKKKIGVEELIKERFILTNSGAISMFRQGLPPDGWRDDKLKRNNIFYTDSLKALDESLLNGLGVSYLPDFYGAKLGLREINVTDCPFTCKFSLYLCRNKYSLNGIWSLF